MGGKVLIIGGTGTISTAITERLLSRGDIEVIHYNRGLRNSFPSVRTIVGDRRRFAEFEAAMAGEEPFDCVIDMIGYEPDEIASAIRAFSGRVGQYVFCSTVDVYTKRAAYYPIDERHERKALPSFSYAYNKMLCENLLFGAHDERSFPVTIIRPAQTYGGTGFVVPSLGGGLYNMRRLREGRPIIVHGDGTSIWAACHRDDVARAFEGAVGNPAAVGNAYNTAGEQWMTFDEYWRITADALGAPEPKFVHIPSDLLGAMLPQRALWCVENFKHNNIFDNSAAKRDLGFAYTIRWEDGIRSVIRELDKDGAIERAEEEPYYDSLISLWECHAESMTAAMRPRDFA